MPSQTAEIEPLSSTIRGVTVLGIATGALAVGLLIGYLAHDMQLGVQSAQPRPNFTANPPAATPLAKGHVPSIGEMKQMADTQVAPLLEKLKSDPNNTALLVQVGAVYHTSHQFKEAATYFNRAVQLEPTNVPLRTKLASSLFREGDADGAIEQLNQALGLDPKDANSLFNLGMIKLQGKNDPRGALAAWQKLLKTNPNLSPERKAEVQKLIANVLTMMSDQKKAPGAETHAQP